MSNSSKLPKLPEGWFYPEDSGIAAGLHAELQRELPPGHLLFGHAVETFAYRRDQDDVLFRHQDEPDRFTVIHLTWIRKREINAEHPSVCFDGPFERFFAEEETYYLKRRRDAS
jgi:hypothetical protein